MSRLRRRLLIGGAIVCVALVLVRWGLRQVALGQLVELTGAKVETKSVAVGFDGSVSIRGLVLRGHRERQYDDALFRAQSVYARFGWGGLLLLRPRLEEISVEDFVFDAQYDLASGRWNTEALEIKFPRGGGGRMPVVRLAKGVLQYSKVVNGRVKAIAAVPVEASFGPDEEAQEAYAFKITTAKIEGGYGKSRLTGLWRAGRVTFAGGLSSADIAALEKVWTIKVLAGQLEYDQNEDFSLKLRARDVYSRYRLDGDGGPWDVGGFGRNWGLLAAMQQFFSRYRPAGRVDVELEASGNLRDMGKSEVKGVVHCKDVCILDRTFPYPVEHIAGRLEFSETGLALRGLVGEHGDVQVGFDGWYEGFDGDGRYEIVVSSDNLSLDDDLYKSLNPRQQRLWSRFSPSGAASIEYRRAKPTPGVEEKTLTVDLIDAQATYEGFAYPLKHLSGRLAFEDGVVTLSDVVSESDGHRIRLAGQIRRPDELQEPSYRLSVWAEQMALEDDWIGLLPPAAKSTVSKLRAQGKINLKVELDKPAGDDGPDCRVTVECLGNRVALSSGQETERLVPVGLERFLHSLEDVRGIIEITSDSVGLRQVTATVADRSGGSAEGPVLKMSGQASFSSGRFSEGVFEIAANDVVLDEQLGSRLPASVRGLYSTFSPSGRCDLDLKRVRIFDGPEGAGCVEVTGGLVLKGCDLDVSPAVSELEGRLDGELLFRSGTGVSEGQAALLADKLRIKGQCLTGLEANISYQGSRHWVAKDITAECYGGKLTGKLESSEAAEGALGYELQIGFDSIDLKAFLEAWTQTRTAESPASADLVWSSGADLDGTGVWQEEGSGVPEHSSGKVCGSDERIGKCKLAITDMQVGKLSPLAKLLYVLSLSEPTDFAFDEMFVDSYIKHNKLFFECLDLSGSGVALTGSGSMDLADHTVDLVLFARGRRLAAEEPSVLESLTESLGSTVVRMEVTGSFYDPTVSTKTLPLLQQTLELFSAKPSSTAP
ncbi:MAG: hypothetical protein ACYTEX_23030 [Planctomycetota bacterium]|jgi:hypothetical protein